MNLRIGNDTECLKAIAQVISPKVKVHLNHLGKTLSDADLSNYDRQGVTSRTPLTDSVYLSTRFSPSDRSFEFSRMREECQTPLFSVAALQEIWSTSVA